MYAVTYVEHIKALEGLGDSGTDGKRTGKITDGLICLFEDAYRAHEWCKKPNWADPNKREDSVRTFWYEIWHYTVQTSAAIPMADPLFVAAYNRYGKLITESWTPGWIEVIDSEEEYQDNLKERLVKESLVSIEMPTKDMIDLFAQIAENAVERVLDERGVMSSEELKGIINKKIDSFVVSINEISKSIRNKVIVDKEKKRGKGKTKNST